MGRDYEALTREQRSDVDRAMKAARGLPAHRVNQIVRTYQRAVDYQGVGKRDIFCDLVRHRGARWRNRVWIPLLEALRAEPRPPSRAEVLRAKAQAQAAADEQRAEEAKGWTAEAAEVALKRAEEQLRLYRSKARKAELRVEKLHRILGALDPDWGKKRLLRDVYPNWPSRS